MQNSKTILTIIVLTLIAFAIGYVGVLMYRDAKDQEALNGERPNVVVPNQ